VWSPAASRDTKDDPAKVRPGYGNSDVHLWLPLGETELSAIKGIDRARQGDAHALLDLALVASGDHRDGASFAQYRQRVDAFITELKPTVDAADEWHKGFEINRAMHRVFFNGEKTDLGSYSLDQARLTGVFTTGKYNCISSAMLYVVLARGFGLPVRGVLVPTHVFVEYGTPGGKLLEVETTSATGFDWIHDARYFKEEAEGWSKNRGLRPLTLDDYNKRQVIEPYVLMAHAMLDARAGEDDNDHRRLFEIAALLAPELADVQKNAMFVWVNEAIDLYKQKQWHTLVKLFDTVAPSIAIIANTSKDPAVLQHIAWMRYYYAHALVIVNRPDDAIAMMDEGLKTLDPTWKDYLEIRAGLLWVLMDHLLELMHKKDYTNAVAFVKPRFDLCKSDPQCAQNLGVIYINQSVEQINEHSWNAARTTLKECVALVPLATECKTRLDDLESQHAF
jgi:hypothetical protein